MSAKDPFQILADELTLIRKDMDRLQRTSLDKDEAQALHQIVAEAVANMRKATREAPQALQSVLKADREDMGRKAAESATAAAERVLGDIRAQLCPRNVRGSHRPPGRPAERHGAISAGSGSGWPPCSPQASFWAS